LVVENAFSNDLLSRLHSEFLTKYDPLLQGGHVENALKVGNDRYMMTLDIEGAFNSPEVYANRFLQKLFTRLLGDDYVLGSFTAVTSLAGAPDMRVHKDHPALFPEDNSSTQIPTFAITVLLPLLGMTSELGTTRVVKGSHRKSSEDSACMPHQDPLGPAGSCLLMDYRLTHQGLANRSNQVRPVLSMVYNRPWFRDAVNYRKQPPLALSVEEFANIPEAHQNLMQWFVAQRDQVAT
jgi:ectoine hydroxylase-related dioxygenase (phytanoyl-CoA dioxygenase family)